MQLVCCKLMSSNFDLLARGEAPAHTKPRGRAATLAQVLRNELPKGSSELGVSDMSSRSFENMSAGINPCTREEQLHNLGD